MTGPVGDGSNAEVAGVPSIDGAAVDQCRQMPHQEPRQDDLQPHDQPSGQQDGQQSENSNAQQPPIDPAISGSTASPSEASTLPASFPKKRRGRPPGRPNTTVRDADYEQNPLVQAWNAAKHDRPSPVVSVSIREALSEQSLVHETQRAVFRMPSRETVLFVQGWITAKHIASQRPSYVNGLLIHSRGQDAAVSCTQCVEKRAKNALGPFLTCRVLPGTYHNSCSNCKWFDNTSNCSLYTGPKPNRKRKAKEQLPPPPAPSEANGNAEATQGDATSGRQLHPQYQSSLQGHTQPQPEANMARQGEYGQQPGMTPATDQTDYHQSARSQSHNGSRGSELPEPPSQPDSLTESHFVLSKRDREDSQSGEDGDADFVAAQLAAQLLPELQRPDL